MLTRELNSAIFQYEQVQQIYYQINGSFAAWSQWLETVEEPITRAKWEAIE